MKLDLYRKHFTQKSTIGELHVNGAFECFTLEDVVRQDPNPATPANEAKVYGETAIPAGTYQVVINMSSRFKQLMPLLLKVPGFEGIRIHKGNKAKDTHGCILVGLNRAPDFVGGSGVAYDRLFAKLQAALKAGEPIAITIH